MTMTNNIIIPRRRNENLPRRCGRKANGEDEDMDTGRMAMRRFLELVIRRDECQFKKALMRVSTYRDWFVGRGMSGKTSWFLVSLAYKGQGRKLTPRQVECGRDALLKHVWLLLEHLGEEAVRDAMEKMGEPDEDGCYAGGKQWAREAWE
jgi:hypothetical protein